MTDFDLAFRPKTYFWPLSLQTHILSRIKGAERRALAKQYFEDGRVKDLPEELTASALSETLRKYFGSVHPAFLGGEFLPDHEDDEIEIARITIDSTTQDVTCVYARRSTLGIYYRVVDEYEGDTLSDSTELVSSLPLSLGELLDFFLTGWNLIGVLNMNFEDDRTRILEFFRGASEFYPGLDDALRARVESSVQIEFPNDDDE